MCIYDSRGLSNKRSLVSGNDIVRQTLTYKQSRFGGDVAETGAANSPVRIGLGV